MKILKAFSTNPTGLIASRQRLIVDLARQRKEQRKQAEEVQPQNDTNGVKTKERQKAQQDIPYLRSQNSLPEDVLYRPIYDPELRSVVVDVNLAHPFSKAVFSVSPGEGKKSIPRKATTAVQQLLYVFGHVEYMLNDDENQELMGQFRRYASMNLRALLAD
jgi:phage protein D